MNEAETVEQFLARGGKIDKLPPGPESLNTFDKTGQKYTEYGMGKKRKHHTEKAAKEYSQKA
tara:strand:+ start:421 stop:606 length:186 start_codon:yes stop_codon:yes gene_type:complete